MMDISLDSTCWWGGCKCGQLNSHCRVERGCGRPLLRPR